ncbi:MAG: methenyltetrahydromethanopterin cyclohydrolase [Aureliella sp.]
MGLGNGLNSAAQNVFDRMCAHASALRIKLHRTESGAKVLDCGVNAPGGVQAGLQFAQICMAGHADVQLVPGPRDIWQGPWIQVQTDWPQEACMLGQYAGWPVKDGKFFAMASGPMRTKRGKEELLKELQATDDSPVAVGTLECTELPSDRTLRAMADECSIAPEQLMVAVAPTSSLAGCAQVVARSVETALHKLHELKFPLANVQSATGIAPLPTPTPDFGLGIGRTNDAILYGGNVTLWVTSDDSQIEAVGSKLPSCASSDYGKPFAETFKACGYDFYKIDPGLFSPAEVTLVNMSTGNSWRFGRPRADLIAKSFATTQSSSAGTTN